MNLWKDILGTISFLGDKNVAFEFPQFLRSSAEDGTKEVSSDLALSMRGGAVVREVGPAALESELRVSAISSNED